MNEDRRSILWTGGFDSTALVVDALVEGYAVDAYVWRGYGMQPGWQKVDNEDAARDRIHHGLPSDLRQRLTQHVETDYSRIRPAMRAAYDELIEALPQWSRQNEVLAALPALVGPVEAGFVDGDATIADPVQRSLLERAGIRFPLASFTKADLYAEAERRGYAHLLDLTWSCEAGGPGRQPCGDCEPCRHRVVPARSYK